MSLAPLATRARRIRALYARWEKRRGGRPWTRAELAQGFVGDVGDLMKLLMAKDGVRAAAQLEQRLGHEMGDCLWSLLVLADAYGVDLETAFQRTMDELEARLAAPKPNAPRRTKTGRKSRARRG
jgi:NTP pyrophosphatase (non-canonical NTP hydrolase)